MYGIVGVSGYQGIKKTSLGRGKKEKKEKRTKEITANANEITCDTSNTVKEE